MPAKRIYLDAKDYNRLKRLTPDAKNDSERIRSLMQKVEDLKGIGDIVRSTVSRAIEDLKRY